MAKIYIEDTLKNSVNLINRMDEISINKKKQDVEAAIDAINGKGNHVKTFCILTAYNPMAQKSSHSDNTRANNQLMDRLKTGHYAYVPVKGKYGNTENSFVIFNLPLDSAKFLADEASQESFIYGRVTGDNADSAVFDLYVYNEETGKYDFVETKNYHNNGATIVKDKETGKEKEDYFTQVGDKKFSVPFDYFNETAKKFNEIINERLENSEQYRAHYEQYQNNILQEGRTESSSYLKRSLIYGTLFENLEPIDLSDKE